MGGGGCQWGCARCWDGSVVDIELSRDGAVRGSKYCTHKVLRHFVKCWFGIVPARQPLLDMPECDE